MFELFFISSVVVLILLTWFQSEAFVEYAELASGGKFFHTIDYKEKQKSKATLTYQGYLLQNHSSFFIRLITCPLCLSFWLTLITTLAVTGSLWFFPLCNILSLIVYFLMLKLLEL